MDETTFQHVERVVARAPSLSAEQRERLARLLRDARPLRGAEAQESIASAKAAYATSNPFGKWTRYRAQIAAMSRVDAHDVALEAEARTLLKAARLADVILRDRASITAQQRDVLAALLIEEEGR